VKVGDLVKFSKEHYSAPGFDYTEDWFGVVVETGATGFHYPINEIKIMWTIHGGSTIMHYDEIWWNKLSYDPFEVVYESR